MTKAKQTPTKGPTLHMQKKGKDGKPLPNVKAESARGLYLARFAEFDGKPLAELEASCAANPPSMPKSGKLAGKQEPFSGWLRHWVSSGFVIVKD